MTSPARGAPPFGTIRTIAVGFDGSADASEALDWALRLAGALDADVVVVHAVGLLEHAAGAGGPAELEERVARRASAAGLPDGRVRWDPADGDPTSVLLRATAQPLGADLLVVGSRGHGGHAGLLLGSTSHEVSEQSAVPVVIVPRRS